MGSFRCYKALTCESGYMLKDGECTGEASWLEAPPTSPPPPRLLIRPQPTSWPAQSLLPSGKLPALGFPACGKTPQMMVWGQRRGGGGAQGKCVWVSYSPPYASVPTEGSLLSFLPENSSRLRRERGSIEPFQQMLPQRRLWAWQGSGWQGYRWGRVLVSGLLMGGWGAHRRTGLGVAFRWGPKRPAPCGLCDVRAETCSMRGPWEGCSGRGNNRRHALREGRSLGAKNRKGVSGGSTLPVEGGCGVGRPR